MAKLVTTKEKYGVSVAARIDPDIAHEIAARAERIGVSMAKMLSLIISRGINTPTPDYESVERINELENQVEENDLELERLQNFYRKAAAELISRIAETDSEKVRMIEMYNDILVAIDWDGNDEA